MYVSRVAPRTKGHSAKAFKAKQVEKGSEDGPREGTAYARVLSPRCWRKNKPREAAQPEFTRPNLGGRGLGYQASGLGLFCLESNKKQRGNRI